MTVTDDPPLATGYWSDGDDPGDRRFLDIGPLELERGGRLPAVRLAYETWGRLAPDGANAVLVEHALTGDSHVVGPAGRGHPSSGWWDGLVGPRHAIDTEQLFVVAANVVGGCQGSTGPSSIAPDGQRWGSRFPFLTIRDQVEAERRLADVLGIERWALVIGGSMGGMRVRRPVRGLGLARRIAHITYRSALELDERFGRAPQAGEDPLGSAGRYAVESYLDHHADKLERRFDANSYLVLTEAMNSHDLGRGRGGIASALARIKAQVTVVAVDSDRLYQRSQSEQLRDGIAGAQLHGIHSRHGHDGFLIEVPAVGRLVRDLLR